MFVVTFYSYKGGVGRTMALTNVAALLAAAGKKVLLVDFDLEAPGVTSYGPFNQASGLPGMVDYIHEYKSTLTSPDVTNFIVRCELEEGKHAWVMPAGDNTTGTYDERLAGIDWGKLYDEQRGYILFEDMKNQWGIFEGQGFDYVLIDSRTGHTDIGGICTRQLPDAVAVLFVPTRQNLNGLAPMLSGIRKQSMGQDKEIGLVFCPSNIPDEYDEDAILSGMLDQASEALDYPRQGTSRSPVVEIHHWMLMDLLEQPLVVKSRPRSRLSKEYENLRRAIVGLNLEDREGALISLRLYLKSFDDTRQNGESADRLLAMVGKIARQHGEDAEIASLSADLFMKAGDFEQADEKLTTAIEAQHQIPRNLIRRAVARSNLNRKESALEDVLHLLARPEASFFEVRPAVQILRRLASDPVEAAFEAFTRPDITIEAKNELVWVILQDPRYSDKIVTALEKDLEAELARDPGRAEINSLKNLLHLTLISARRFEDAIERFHKIDEGGSEEPAFNGIMAEWGASGTLPRRKFAEFNASFPDVGDADPNTLQCFALVKAVIGEKQQALDLLAQARRAVPKGSLTFSCWNYQTRESADFMSDLDAMLAQIEDDKGLRPPVFETLDVRW